MLVESNARPSELTPMKGQNARLNSGKSKKRSFYLLNTISRISTWFFLITILFRCPSSIDLVTEDSPRICKPYFQVAHFVAPTLQPYFQTYAEPYIETARPYYVTLEKKVIRPVVALGKSYGTPFVAKLHKISKAYHLKYIQPITHHYRNVLYQQYRQILGPYLEKAFDVISPYYNNIKINAQFIYADIILSNFDIIQPQMVNGYSAVSKFTTNTIYPYTRWALMTGKLFLSKNVGPRLRIIYGENVEPQLIKIGERLGRYRDVQTMKSAENEIKSSPKISMPISQTSTALINPAHSTPSLVSSKSKTGISTTSESRAKILENARQIVSRDLREWQENFAKAADEGADELENRITEITERFMLNQVEIAGKELITDLENAVKIGLKNLKANIVSIVRESNEENATKQDIVTAVRKTGIIIKEKAQAARIWKQTHYHEMTTLVKKATIDTLDILDTIRDTSLQEVGMRWAWTDGITYKDWTKYHSMKTKFAEWRNDVQLIENYHPGVIKARAAFENIEAEVLNIAEHTAKELVSLREIGLWKLSVKDTSDNFIITTPLTTKAHESQEILEIFQNPPISISPSDKKSEFLTTPTKESTTPELLAFKSSPQAGEIRNVDSTIHSDMSDAFKLDPEMIVINSDAESASSTALKSTRISADNFKPTIILDTSTSYKSEKPDTKLLHVEVK